jgi:transposase
LIFFKKPLAFSFNGRYTTHALSEAGEADLGLFSHYIIAGIKIAPVDQKVSFRSLKAHGGYFYVQNSSKNLFLEGVFMVLSLSLEEFLVLSKVLNGEAAAVLERSLDDQQDRAYYREVVSLLQGAGFRDFDVVVLHLLLSCSSKVRIAEKLGISVVEASRWVKLVRKAVLKLTNSVKDSDLIFVRYRLNGDSIKEIARRLGLAESVVSRRTARIRMAVKDISEHGNLDTFLSSRYSA